MTPTTDQLLARLIELQEASLEELRTLNAKLTQSRCSSADRRVLERILPAIAGTFGSQGLPTKEILADRAIAELCAPLDTQRVGNLLARAAADGVVINGLQVSRIATEGNAALWQVTGRLPDPLE